LQYSNQNSKKENAIAPIGSQLREHRKALKLSMKEVAEAAGLSIGFISQVERGLTAPSLSSLSSIAKVLNTDISTFLSQPEGKSSFTSHKDRAVYTLSHRDLQYERLSASFPGSVLNSVIMHEMPGHRLESIKHEGEEFFFILEGAITIYLEGEENILEVGDSIHFDSMREHSVWNHTDNPTIILHVCTLNIFGDKQDTKEIPSIRAGHKGV
jgi:transcriptional regulator with XRE-family HTH domain